MPMVEAYARPVLVWGEVTRAHVTPRVWSRLKTDDLWTKSRNHECTFEHFKYGMLELKWEG